MERIQLPDRHSLNAAIGWLELGNPSEAKLELRQIASRYEHHPEYLAVEWRIVAAESNWESALELARQLIRVAPERPEGWIDQSYSLHELKRTDEARKELLAVVQKLPANEILPYNLACYACHLGKLDEARQWLLHAVRIRGRLPIKLMALEDPDLRPLTEFIQAL